MTTALKYSKKHVPLVIGHPADDKPEFGEVNGLFVKDGGLWAQCSVHSQMVEMMRAGRYKKVSASFYPPKSPLNPIPGLYHLKHVGFLGAHAPSVKGMSKLDFAEVRNHLDFSEGYGVTLESHKRHFAAPPGYAVAAQSLKLHEMAIEYQLACPSLSYIEAASLAATVVFI